MVLYGGVNDIIVAFEHNDAGLHLNFTEFRHRFEQFSPHNRVEALLMKSSQYQLVQRLVPPAPTTAQLAPTYNYRGRHDSAELAAAVASTYLANVAMIQALANAYGFRAACFWQATVILGDKPLTDVEHYVRTHEPIRPFVRKVYGSFREQARSVPNVHDVTGVFDQDASLVYLDWHHTTLEGNRKIAQAIAQRVF